MVKNRSIRKLINIDSWTEQQAFSQDQIIDYLKKGTLKFEVVNFTGFSANSIMIPLSIKTVPLGTKIRGSRGQSFSGKRFSVCDCTSIIWKYLKCIGLKCASYRVPTIAKFHISRIPTFWYGVWIRYIYFLGSCLIQILSK